MLKYKDFVPKRIPGQAGGFFSAATPERHESFDKALDEANAWISNNEINILNVETVVLPNIWAEHEEGTEDGSLYTSGTSHRHQFIRCWFTEI